MELGAVHGGMERKGFSGDLKMFYFVFAGAASSEFMLNRCIKFIKNIFDVKFVFMCIILQ
jgi:hypothetical protein